MSSEWREGQTHGTDTHRGRREWDASVCLDASLTHCVCCVLLCVFSSVWLYKRRCRSQDSAHDSAGFSRVQTTLDEHDEQFDKEAFADERANERL